MKFLSLIFLVSLLSCAQTTILQDLDQGDANEVMVLLARHGIEAKKEVVEKRQETSWSIIVAPGDQEAARELLVANHIPRKKELGLSGVCKEAGLIPTPKTEKCRELLALKGEIINSLESLPAVVNADVVLNIPDKEDFPDADTPPERPTASVVVQVGEADVGLEAITESKIQQFVANSVTGMDMRDVSVIISRVPGSPDNLGDKEKEEVVVAPETNPIPPSGLVLVGGLQMDPSSAKKFKMLAILFLVFLAVLSVALIVVLVRQARTRQKPVFAPGDKPALPERVVMDQLVEEAGREEKKGRT